MISVNRLERRKSDISPRDWILDSGAFTRIASGAGHMPIAEYARQIQRWSRCGSLLAAVSQDYMCESFILDRTGLTVADHQRLTTETYIALRALVQPDIHVMPVIQGYAPDEYVEHVRQYGDLLAPGMWVGVGSVCKRNGDPAAIEAVLLAIKRERPDLRLHGFGLKSTALGSPLVVSLLETADSMAWSYAAWRNGRDQNSAAEAMAYVRRIEGTPRQGVMQEMFL